MQFAHDTEESLEFAVELGNTAPDASRSGADELATREQLADFLARFAFSGRIDADERERHDVLRARDQVRLVWRQDRDTAVLQVNTMLEEARAMPTRATVSNRSCLNLGWLNSPVEQFTVTLICGSPQARSFHFSASSHA